MILFLVGLFVGAALGFIFASLLTIHKICDRMENSCPLIAYGLRLWGGKSGA